jgi:hypothetical protein
LVFCPAAKPLINPRAQNRGKKQGQQNIKRNGEQNQQRQGLGIKEHYRKKDNGKKEVNNQG